jgi:hypothetical protein
MKENGFYAALCRTVFLVVSIVFLLLCASVSVWAQEVETQEENPASCRLLQNRNNDGGWVLVGRGYESEDKRKEKGVISSDLWKKVCNDELSCLVFLDVKTNGIQKIEIIVQKKSYWGYDQNVLVIAKFDTSTPWTLIKDQTIRWNIEKMEFKTPDDLNPMKTLFLEYIVADIHTFPNETVRFAMEDILKNYFNPSDQFFRKQIMKKQQEE